MPPSVRQRLPNMLTMARLVLAVAFFILLQWYHYPATSPWLLNVAVIVFIIAAITDALDGYLARKWDVVSPFGRVMDPVCDKVLVLGALIFLAGPNFIAVDPGSVAGETTDAGIRTTMLSGIYPWMVVVIVARELLVTSIRGLMESSGIEFGAKAIGKYKMILQSVVVPVVLLLVANADPLQHTWSRMIRDSLVYVTVIVTVLSGVPYVTAAWAALSAPSSDPPGEGTTT